MDSLHHVTCLFLLTSGCFFARAASQSQETWILASLGDHGDRIANMEKLINTLTTNFGGLQKTVTDLMRENMLLKSELRILSATCSCSNNQATTTTTKPLDMASTTSSTPIAPLMTSLPTTSRPMTANTTKTTAMSVDTTTTPNTTAAGIINTTPAGFAATNATVNSTQAATTSTTTSAQTTPQATTQTTTQPTTQAPTTQVPTTTTTQTPTTTEYAWDNCNSATGRSNNHGVFNIKVGSTGQSVKAYCDANGWLVIQRRSDGSQSFDQNWDAYKNGFGDPKGEYWLETPQVQKWDTYKNGFGDPKGEYWLDRLRKGNEIIHQLTTSGDYTLRIEMEDWASNQKYEQYEHFHLDNEINAYRLYVGSASGTAGDSFHYPESYMLSHFQMRFSTPDRDNDHSDTNCAKELHSGWWFNACYSSNLNGKYLDRAYGQHMLGETYGQPTMSGTGIEWYPLKKHQYSLKTVVMKIKLGAPAAHTMIG